MNAYEERKQRKIEYAKNRATELKASSEKFFEKSFCEHTGIPAGQPILVGHHSEKRHRRTIERYENLIRKNIADAEKAEYYEERANRLENDTTISSDDPEAVTKLKEKLKGLQDQRERIKETNKQRRKEGKDGHPSYILSNLGQNIRSVEKRIKLLERNKAREAIEEDYGEIKLKVATEDNRVRLFFPGKPSEEVRTKLKSNGFRWSPYNGAWQAFMNDWNIRNARNIAKEWLEGKCQS